MTVSGSTWFESDNCASVHPQVMQALARANQGHEPSYGYDRYTRELDELIPEIFGAQACAYPVFNGTAANVLSLQQLTTRWGGVVCADWSHINTNEGGAPEKVAGVKLLTSPGTAGKISVDDINWFAHDRGDEHRTQPEVLSFAQTSEFGRVYSLGDVAALSTRAHELALKVHMDGARISNAAAALDTSLQATSAGVDVLSMGGTKNGLMFGELIVDLTGAMGDQMLYLRKQNMQLASKMRYISAQFLALFTDELWRANATQANAMASRLAAGLEEIPGAQLVVPVESNAVWAALPPAALRVVGEQFGAHANLDGDTGAARIMCAFDTTESDVDLLVAALRASVA